MKINTLEGKETSASETVWAFDLGKGSIGETENKEGASRLQDAPNESVRVAGSDVWLSSPTVPQVLIWEK